MWIFLQGWWKSVKPYRKYLANSFFFCGYCGCQKKKRTLKIWYNLTFWTINCIVHLSTKEPEWLQIFFVTMSHTFPTLFAMYTRDFKGIISHRKNIVEIKIEENSLHNLKPYLTHLKIEKTISQTCKSQFTESHSIFLQFEAHTRLRYNCQNYLTFTDATEHSSGGIRANSQHFLTDTHDFSAQNTSYSASKVSKKHHITSQSMDKKMHLRNWGNEHTAKTPLNTASYLAEKSLGRVLKSQLAKNHSSALI